MSDVSLTLVAIFLSSTPFFVLLASIGYQLYRIANALEGGAHE
jgi:hypothetical protein